MTARPASTVPAPNFKTNRVIQGDCIRAMARLPAECARLCVADPPYFRVLTREHWDRQWPDYASYLDWTAQWMVAAMRVLMPGGLLYCFGQLGRREHVMLHLMSQAAHTWQFHDLIVWDRVVHYERRDSFTPAYEMIVVLRKPGKVFFDRNAVREPYDEATKAVYLKDKRYSDLAARRAYLDAGKYATNLWRIPSLKGSSKEKIGHPSQKPCAVVERIIKSSSRSGELVIDPFLGSGTTAVVAEAFGRQWIGFERDREFCDLARRRIRSERRARQKLGNSETRVIVR